MFQGGQGKKKEASRSRRGSLPGLFAPPYGGGVRSSDARRVHPLGLTYERGDLGFNQIDSDLIFATTRDNQVGVHARWLDKLLEHGPHRFQVLTDNGVNISAPVEDVALQAAHEADVQWGIHVEPNIELLTYFRLNEQENAFENNDIGWCHSLCVTGTVVYRMVILGYVNGLARTQTEQMVF